MNADRLKKRVIRRLTTPQEVFYALSRHWLGVAFCFFAASGIMIGKVMTEPPAYEGKATLLFTRSGDASVPELGDAFSSARNPADWQTLFNARVDILTSDSVIRNVVKTLKSSGTLPSSTESQETENRGLKGYFHALRAKVGQSLEFLENQGEEDRSPDRDIQKAILWFRQCTNVVPNVKNGSVDLLVYGVNRDQILTELRVWKEQYIDYLLEMQRNTADILITNLKDFWEKEENRARTTLEEYLEQARKDLSTETGQAIEVSDQAKDALFPQLTQLQMQYYNLENQLYGEGTPPVAQNPLLADKEREKLLEDKGRLEGTLREARPHYPKDSLIVKSLELQLQEVVDQLAGNDPGKSGASLDSKETRIKERLSALSTQINGLYKRYGLMVKVLEKTKELKNDIENAKREKRKFEEASYMRAGMGDLRINLQVQESDKPHVSSKPYDAYRFRQVLFGSLGGLGIGIVLALLRELVNGKIRFVNDVPGECGLPVVGVLPRR